MQLNWQCFSFTALTNQQLYEILKLRTEIFVVEQNCPYLETDGLDCAADTYHLLGYFEDKIVAYARLLPAGLSYTNASIGRVLVAKQARGKGLGHLLLKQALAHCARLWPNQGLTIGAQYHLRGFYQQQGFAAISEPYDEDGILHIKMQR